MHELDAGKRLLSGKERLEAQRRLHNSFYKTMILFHHIVQVFDLRDDELWEGLSSQDGHAKPGHPQGFATEQVGASICSLS